MRLLLIIALLAAAVVRADDDLVIAAFGDSLSAGYGLPQANGFAPVLEEMLQARGVTVRVINAAVSGDTTADGLQRVDWMLETTKPDLVIVEFGANDMFRGVPVEVMRQNFDAMLIRIQAAGATVLLAGMLAPNNYGQHYQKQFNELYRGLSERHNIPLYPFFLRDVALEPTLNLADGRHPNAEGVRVIAGHMAPLIVDMIAELP